MHASLASRQVNICLIPEVYFQLYGPSGVYERVIQHIKTSGYCVVVIAEGAEEGLIDEEKKAIYDKIGIQNPNSGEIKYVDLAKFIMTDLF